jgi:putative transposase
LTFSCFHKFPFLSKERTCRWLADAINKARRDLEYSLWAYVFMPDHVHLVIYPQRAVYDTSEFIKYVKEPVSRDAIAFLKSEAPEGTRGRCAVMGLVQRELVRGCASQRPEA